MKLREVMSKSVVRIQPDETVTVAARLLEHNNIGAMPVCGTDGRLCGMLTDRDIPVCGTDGRLCGMLTDRDIVTRCLAAGKSPQNTSVREIMTGKVYVARPDMEVSVAAGLMGREQIRRLPVMENGKLCGIVSLGDLAIKEGTKAEAGGALVEISSHLSSRG